MAEDEDRRAQERHEALGEWRRRRPRNIALLIFLLAIFGLLYVLTIVRMGGAS